jgi:hypothetical protein
MLTIELKTKNGNTSAHYVARNVDASGRVISEACASEAVNAAGMALNKASGSAMVRDWRFAPNADVAPARLASLGPMTFVEFRAAL